MNGHYIEWILPASLALVVGSLISMSSFMLDWM